MSTATAPKIPPIELDYEDDQPMDSPWHRAQMELLIQTTHVRWQDRSDYYTGGNMFVYFSFEQARTHDYRGPDYFTVVGVDGSVERKAWVVWEESGRYPDVIIELLSPTTRAEDLGTKKDLYERVFRTPEYFCYDPDTRLLMGWRLIAGRYLPIAPDENGRFPCHVLDSTLGFWEGSFDRVRGVWIRLWDAAGELVPSPPELAAVAEARASEAEAHANEAREVCQVMALYYREGVTAAASWLRALPGRAARGCSQRWGHRSGGGTGGQQDRRYSDRAGWWTRICAGRTAADQRRTAGDLVLTGGGGSISFGPI